MVQRKRFELILIELRSKGMKRELRDLYGGPGKGE